MSKRAQRKRKLTFHANVRERWFVLTQKSLTYHEGGRPGAPGRLKGIVPVSNIKAVAAVNTPGLQDTYLFEVR